MNILFELAFFASAAACVVTAFFGALGTLRGLVLQSGGLIGTSLGSLAFAGAGGISLSMLGVAGMGGRNDKVSSIFLFVAALIVFFAPKFVNSVTTAWGELNASRMPGVRTSPSNRQVATPKYNRRGASGPNATFKLRWLVWLIGAWLLINVIAQYPNEFATRASGEEVTGTVVETSSGKFIPNAIVAIKYPWVGSRCFRATAVRADEMGRFRFPPWTQTDINGYETHGEIKAFARGFTMLMPAVKIDESPRMFLGIPYTDSIRIPKAAVKVELDSFVGNAFDRRQHLRSIANEFGCSADLINRVYVDTVVLLAGVRDELVEAGLAAGSNDIERIDELIESQQRR